MAPVNTMWTWLYHRRARLLSLAGILILGSAFLGLTPEPAEGSLLKDVHQFQNEAHAQNRDPFIIEDSQGQLCMVFQTQNGSLGGEDIYFVRTIDGTNWGEPVLVEDYDWKDGYAELAEGDPGQLYLSYSSAKDEGSGRSWNVYFSRSEDHGETWTVPRYVAGNEWDGETPFGIAVEGSSVWIAYKVNKEVYLISSPDNGENWGPPYLLLEDTIVGKGSLMMNHEGDLILAISNQSNGDLLIFRSQDGDNWDQMGSIPLSVAPYTMNIVQDDENEYWMVFDSEPYDQMELFITSSPDLLNWKAPERLTVDPRIDWDVSIAYRESGILNLVWERAVAINATAEREIFIGEIHNPKLTLELLSPQINYVAEEQDITVRTRLHLKGGMVHNLSLDLVEDHGLTSLDVDEKMISAAIGQNISLTFRLQVPVDPTLSNFQLQVRAISDETISNTETILFDYLFLNLSITDNSDKSAAPGDKVSFSFKIDPLGGTIENPMMVILEGEYFDLYQQCQPLPNVTEVDEGVCTLTLRVPTNATVGQQFQLTVVAEHELGASNEQVLTIIVREAGSEEGWMEKLTSSPPQLAAGILLMVVVLTFMVMETTPKGQERLWPLFFPLYARIRKEKVMDNLMRGQLMEYIRENPGCTIMDLMEQAKVSRATMLYHLSVLEGHEFIRCRPHAGYRHYYPTGELMTEGGEHSTPAAENVYRFIAVNPGLSIKQLTVLTGTSKQAVQTNIMRLQLDKRVQWQREKRARNWYAIKE